MNAGPLSEPSDVVGTGLGDRSYREGDSPEDVDCSASLPSQSVLRGGSLTSSPLPPSGILLSSLWTDSKVLGQRKAGDSVWTHGLHSPPQAQNRCCPMAVLMWSWRPAQTSGMALTSTLCRVQTGKGGAWPPCLPI